MSKKKVSKKSTVTEAEIEDVAKEVKSESSSKEKKNDAVDIEEVESCGSQADSCGGPTKCPRVKWVLLFVVLIGIATWAYMKKNNIDSVGELFTGGLKTVSEVDAGNKDQFSYAVGVKIGEQLNTMMKVQEDEIDKSVVVSAIRDVLTERKMAMNAEQVEELMVAREEIEKEKFEKKSIDAIAEGEKFMIEYATGENVTKLDGNVLVKELTKGDGAIVGAKTAKVHYRGKLTDGTEFDSSYKYGDEPVAFNAKQVVPGFGTALTAMRVGDKWEIVIPADQAYGPAGTPDGTIGPNATLIFELEVVGVE